MQIRSFSGEDEITNLCTAAMNSTVQVMTREGLITPEVAEKFLSRHVAILTSHETFWDRVRKALRLDDEKGDVVVIMEVK